MKKYTKQEIEDFFVNTTSGFYLKRCAENGGEDEKEFYKNQLEEFTAGFECCFKQITSDAEA